MGNFFKESNVVDRERLGQRIKEQIAEGNVDVGHVEHHKYRRGEEQRDTKVHPIESVAHKSLHRSSRLHVYRLLREHRAPVSGVEEPQEVRLGVALAGG
ncbi:hypothetical protein D3C73_1408910 [compost metagenome]